MNFTKNNQSGFTLIEMIVSLAVFSVVVTISVGAMLSMIAANSQLQGEQSVMTNITFAIDSMTREMRTGTHYFCDTRNNYNAGPDKIFKAGTNLDNLGNRSQDCASGRSPQSHQLHGVAFKESGNSITGGANERILYFFDKTAGTLYRRIGTAAAQSIVSSGITIEDVEFYVTGSASLGGGSSNIYQPTVTIFIKASEKSNPTKKYNIQTTVTQRILDL